MDRRGFLAASFALTPLAAVLSACGRGDPWPAGMVEIKWDRDTCVRCGMVISDRRFAAEMRGGPQNTAFKFDDVGCTVVWLREKAASHPWMAEPATRLWVADASSRGNEVRWLDATGAQYVSRTSPMGYNQAAVALPQPGSMDFAGMSRHVIARGR